MFRIPVFEPKISPFGRDDRERLTDKFRWNEALTTLLRHGNPQWPPGQFEALGCFPIFTLSSRLQYDWLYHHESSSRNKTLYVSALRYLHLSDLHFTRDERVGPDSVNGVADGPRQDPITDSLLTLVGQLADKPLDFVIITGDIAYSGKGEEYRVAARFFDRLARITELSPTRFYPVPGNHDVDRKQVPHSHRRFYRVENQADIGATLTNPDLRGVILRKFGAFNRFTEELTGRRREGETTCYFTEVLHLVRGDKVLAIDLVGLNSALFAGFEGDKEQGLALGLRQVEGALGQMAGDARLSIGFFHHPFQALHDADNACRHRLRNDLDLILHGHGSHAVGPDGRDGPGRAVILGAGAAHESRHKHNGFNLVTIDPASGEGRVRFFGYAPDDQAWVRDKAVCPDDPQGLFRFRIPALAGFIPAEPMSRVPPPEKAKPAPPESGVAVETDAQSTPPPPPVPRTMQVHFLHDHLLPADFTGRVAERRRLMAFLRGEQPSIRVMAIRALDGMGKSCLARRVLEDLINGQNRNDGRDDAAQPRARPFYEQALWFSFCETGTEDEICGFREIIARLSPDTLDPAELSEVVLSRSALAKRLRRQICRHMDRHPTLLILDGLDVILHTDDPQNPHYGHVHETHRETLRLIQHCCNQGESRVLITTGVSPADLEGAACYVALELPALSTEEGAEYMERLGVRGDEAQLEHCSQLFGGYPLCLMAAGKQMRQRRIPAGEVERLIADLDLFRRCSDGKRVARVVDACRAGLSPEQEHFLRMLSIHPRPMTERHFPVLVLGYGRGGQGGREIFPDTRRVWEGIIHPLEARGLIQVAGDDARSDNPPLDSDPADNEGHRWQYSVHPLMKLAFTLWLGVENKNRAHRQWARALRESLMLASSPSDANTLEALRPWLDVVEHYLDAGDWNRAWQHYPGRGIDDRLLESGYPGKLLRLGRRFEQARWQGWALTSGQQRHLYHYLAHACHELERAREAIDYRKKAFAAGQAMGRLDKIVEDGAILAESYAELGEIRAAHDVLAEITAQAGRLPRACKGVHESARAQVALFSGDYSRAISLYESAIEVAKNPYNHIHRRCYLGEARFRAGSMETAGEDLQQALCDAEQHGITSALPCILQRLIWLALKQGRPDIARAHNDRRVALGESLGLPDREDDAFLLLSEGKYRQAADQAEGWLARPPARRANRAVEIRNHLILGQARHGLWNAHEARENLERARTLMRETGCWLEEDRLAEMEAVLQ
uniref:Calcineurin-like phosphoesterase n=1 Tax=Candidatus Kentrum eta TaxID=2126337 RepID=A0A450V0Y8_9GAMM|nr:MAG: Calcineurin-like phosphoesterase [Candidatus Kentron sp. H]VFJ98646.1 MAG: Calcineurin-like phosphoesterase [Candidatus Kentron sp. H]VFK03563.1 MAG: Calcineurin-like phosphoesterase [Candidatus Kentron sp. H]